ncbi:MAG TPA: YdeI/OmpD-associated family protein [Sphingomonas sp.]|nr:YdeI/OmpD-associated family protein [Sphingomonas sp.]
MNQANRDPKVDAYIAAAAPFAQPILRHLRDAVHAECPGVAEAIKWGIPHFDYHGEMMCVMTAYPRHCAFTFLKQAIMRDPRLQANPALKANKRYLGAIASLGDLPDAAELAGFIREAMRLNEEGAKLPERAPKPAADIAMPDAFRERLDADPVVKAVFEGKSPSFRKEYLVWIGDAKTDATRDKRIAEAMAWIAEGKGRFWKYQK